MPLFSGSPAHGFTPAYAGKIRRSHEYLSELRVHPRIRGEDPHLRAVPIKDRGSPPHTRGRFNLMKIILCYPGFTPAYAGKIGINVIYITGF